MIISAGAGLVELGHVLAGIACMVAFGGLVVWAGFKSFGP